MKRLFLFAGAAALAVATAAYAGPGGGHGGGGPHGGGGGGGPPEAHGGGGGGGGNPHFGGGGGGPHGGGGNPHFGGGFEAPMAHGHGGGFAGPMEHGGPRFAGPRMDGGHGHGGPHFTAQRFAGRPQGGHFAAARQHGEAHGQARMAFRQEAHGNPHAQAQMQARQAMANQHANAQAQRMAAVQQQRFAPNTVYQQGVNPNTAENGAGYGVGGCPPGLAKKPVACVPPGLAAKLIPTGIAASPLAAGILAPAYAEQFVGQPLPVVTQAVSLAPLPAALESIYPPTPQYYYQYGDGYVYQVDRTSQLINALMPLFGLGYTAGQQLPMEYANSYVPAALQPFYPQSPYANYDYADGYVYQVDPMTGMISDVIPTLGYGYGVGQMLPASYSAYNLPYQYRPIYPDTADYSYRYAPGAIYQVNPTTGLIQAVMALLTGGMTVGQPLPTGYDVYNVPLDYRAQYYDTPNTWYRYADGDIYSVDPNTGLVTGIVQSVI